jgi:hypothetical protein
MSENLSGYEKRNMNMRKIVLTGVGIFLAATIGGYLLASLPGHLPPFPTQLPFAKNYNARNQENILVVLVNDLKSSQPMIESVWMIYFYPKDHPSLVFMPVYSLKDLKKNPELQADYSYTILGKVSNAFWKTLDKKYKLKWDHYIILDNKAALAIYQQLGGKKPPKPLTLEVSLKKPADYNAAAKLVIKAVCGKIKRGWNEKDSSIKWSKMEPAPQSDQTQSQIKTSWNELGIKPQDDPCNILVGN